MGAELRDLRAKVSPRAAAVLEARHRATGRDKSELVRDILDDWAAAVLHEHTLIDRCLRAEGEPGIYSGAPGNSREDRGGRGRPGE